MSMKLSMSTTFKSSLCSLELTSCHTNLVSRVSLSACKQREGGRVLGMRLIWNWKVILILKLMLVLWSEGPYTLSLIQLPLLFTNLMLPSKLATEPKTTGVLDSVQCRVLACSCKWMYQLLLKRIIITLLFREFQTEQESLFQFIHNWCS